jgi:hypothetical protein
MANKEMGDYLNSRGRILTIWEIDKSWITNYIWMANTKNKNLPADDYWYHLKLDDTTQKWKDIFTLERLTKKFSSWFRPEYKDNLLDFHEIFIRDVYN